MRRATWGCNSFEAYTLAALDAVYVLVLTGGGGGEAEVGRSCCVASCSVKSFKCIYTLLCLLGTVFYTLMRPRSKSRSVIPGMDAPVAGIPLELKLFFSLSLSPLLPLSSPVQIINKRKYIIPLFDPRAKSRPAKVNTKQS